MIILKSRSRLNSKWYWIKIYNEIICKIVEFRKRKMQAHIRDSLVRLNSNFIIRQAVEKGKNWISSARFSMELKTLYKRIRGIVKI